MGMMQIHQIDALITELCKQVCHLISSQHSAFLTIDTVENELKIAEYYSPLDESPSDKQLKEAVLDLSTLKTDPVMMAWHKGDAFEYSDPVDIKSEIPDLISPIGTKFFYGFPLADDKETISGIMIVGLKNQQVLDKDSKTLLVHFKHGAEAVFQSTKTRNNNSTTAC